MSRKKRVVLVVLAGAVLAGALVGGRAALSSSSNVGDPITLSDVSTAVLANDGLTLTQTEAQPAVSQAAAEQTATAAYNGASVDQSVAAHCSVSNIDPPIDQVCWVVALDPSSYRFPSNGPPGATSVRPTYLVVLIDGTSGSVLLAEYGNPKAVCGDVPTC